MIREVLEPREALRRGRALPYGWVCTLSGVTLGPVPAELPLEELLEARFFGPEGEVRLFRREGALQGAALAAEPGEPVIEETYQLQNTALFGRRLTVRRVLQADGDGQCYVAATLLAGWEGGQGHG